METWKQVDWQMVTFIGFSLVNEYLSHFHLPRVYYWSRLREK
ncbi:hypothetical protein [Paenibacillus cremeus]|nr:hypothetical protein [Paenibacillus cremeus]